MDAAERQKRVFMTTRTKKPTLKAQLARRDARVDLLEELLQRWVDWATMRPFNTKGLIVLYRETRAALLNRTPDAF